MDFVDAAFDSAANGSGGGTGLVNSNPFSQNIVNETQRKRC